MVTIFCVYYYSFCGFSVCYCYWNFVVCLFPGLIVFDFMACFSGLFELILVVLVVFYFRCTVWVCCCEMLLFAVL